MEDGTIKVGILLDSDRLPAWQFEAIECMSRLPGVKCFRIDCIGFEPLPRPGEFLNLVTRVDAYLSRSYRKPDALVPHNGADLLPSPAASFRATSLQTDIQAIADLDLSLLLDYTQSLVGDDLATAAPGGIWRHIHSVSGRESRVPAGFWEILNNEPVVASELVMKRQGEEVVLERTWTTSYPYSLTADLNQVLWSSSLLPARAVGRLAGQTPLQYYAAADARQGKSILDNPSIPALGDVGRWLFLLPWRVATTWLYEKRYWDRWEMKYRLGDGLSLDIGEYTDMLPPRGDFWADPHIIHRDGIYYIFLEVYTSRRDLGHLAVIEMDERGHWTPPQDVLIEDYHLSYPHLVAEDDKLFMIPETKENSTIQIYECTDFPLKWEPKMTLMEGVQAVDSTLLHRNGRWWLFVVKSENHVRTWENLYIYSSKALLSTEWTPHPQNPVVSDARSARPGGTILEHEGKLLRPAQDCSWDYGYALRLFEIVKLDESSYEEVEVARVTPDWSPRVKGIHTIARAGNLTVIDYLVGSVAP